VQLHEIKKELQPIQNLDHCGSAQMWLIFSFVLAVDTAAWNFGFYICITELEILKAAKLKLLAMPCKWLTILLILTSLAVSFVALDLIVNNFFLIFKCQMRSLSYQRLNPGASNWKKLFGRCEVTHIYQKNRWFSIETQRWKISQYFSKLEFFTLFGHHFFRELVQ
jgi:hypothetical protein